VTRPEAARIVDIYPRIVGVPKQGASSARHGSGMWFGIAPAARRAGLCPECRL